MIHKQNIQQLELCKIDIESFYDWYTKHNKVTRALKKRRLEALDIAIIELGGAPKQPETNEKLEF